MDPLNNPTPTPTPTPPTPPEPILPPLSPTPTPPAPTPEPTPAPNPVTPPPVPGPAPTMSPQNPIINPTGTAPASPASQLGNLEIAATDPIMTAEPPKAPDPVEEELKAPMKAAAPAPGSIGSAVSGPTDGVPAETEMPINGQPNPFNTMPQEKIQNVAFNDPAMAQNPNPAQGPMPTEGGKKSAFGGLSKLFQEKKTLVILVAVAAVVVVVLLIVLMMQLFSDGGNSAPTSGGDSSSQSPDEKNEEDEEDEDGGSSSSDLNGVVSCLMESALGNVEGATNTSTDKSDILIENGEIVSITSTMTTVDADGNTTTETTTDEYSAESSMYEDGLGLPYDEDGVLTVDSLEEFATTFEDAFNTVAGGMVKVSCQVE